MRAIIVDVERSGGSGLLLRFTIEGDPDGVRLPHPAPPARADDLWRHTCCEAFIGLGGGAYAEFNFSPSRAWAAYHFDAVRQGMKRLDQSAPPVVRSARGADGFVLWAELSGEALPTISAPLGLTAVIEAKDGTHSYWALAHPSAKPDFHDPDGFVARLPPMEQS